MIKTRPKEEDGSSDVGAVCGKKKESVSSNGNRLIITGREILPQKVNDYNFVGFQCFMKVAGI